MQVPLPHPEGQSAENYSFQGGREMVFLETFSSPFSPNPLRTDPFFLKSRAGGRGSSKPASWPQWGVYDH